MTVLRATQKVLGRLRPSIAPPAETADTALGDWYVNRVVVDRHPLLLLVNARSLLSLVQPAREVESLPARLPGLVRKRLRRLGVEPRIVDAETQAMVPVTMAKITDRSVVGYLVDFAQMLPYILERDGWDETTLPFAEEQLARTPCHLGKETVFPDGKSVELLNARWGPT